MNQAGKHFVKINGERLRRENGEDVLFPGVEDAARKHDEVLKSKSNLKDKAEYNFNADGTRIVYEDVSTSSTTGIGGGAASVVPALSVINIKVSLLYYSCSVVSVRGLNLKTCRLQNCYIAGLAPGCKTTPP